MRQQLHGKRVDALLMYRIQLILLKSLLIQEVLKTEILCCRTTSSCTFRFLTVHLSHLQPNDIQKDHSQIIVDDHQLYSDAEIDSIIGRTYTTRGVKRFYEEDPILVEPNQNMYRRNKIIKDKRDLLHLKDTYHLTGSAFNAIFQFIRSKKKLYSLTEVERLRKETNSKFPILFTKTSAYVKFEYAVRTAIFVARQHELNLEKFDKLNQRQQKKY